jgi:hypothetical protein
MANETPGLVLENRYEAPPEFAYRWLTDFHEDDGQRYFGMASPGKIVRNGGTVELEGDMGRGITTRSTVTLAPPDRWSAEGTFANKSGRTMARTRIVESVSPDGTGTHHRADLYLWPNGWMARLFMWMGAGRARREMRAAFGRLKTDLDAEYRSLQQ